MNNNAGNLNGIEVPADETHELILQALAANNIEYLFFCGGTDNYMFMESAKKLEKLGLPHPKLITCLHESAAMHAAYGYFLVSGRPQAVMLHVDNGTLNAGGSWTNFFHGNAGVIVLAGRAPWTSQGEMRGSRDFIINYMQDIYDQGSIVRQYVKWDNELKTGLNAGLVIQRACRIASSEPCGPTYITLPREVLLEKLPGGMGQIYSPENFAPAISPQGDIEALKEAARLLVNAKRPVISVKYMGRHPAAVAALVTLAEKLAVPVVHNDTAFLNFPFGHPLLLTAGALLENTAEEYTSVADVILYIDQDIPWMPKMWAPPAACKIISMDIDPLQHTQPVWDFPVHLPITCDSSKAIPLLNELVDEYITAARKKAFAKRYAEIAAKAKMRATAKAAALARAKRAGSITLAWLGDCINRITDKDTIVVQGLARGVTPGPQNLPGQYFGLSVSSLGWALPVGLGVKLAAPDKIVISACGDGSFIFANPEACLWMARKYGIPTLHVITNNRKYAAVSGPLKECFPDGYCVKSGDFNGSELTPSVDFAGIAGACGAYGEQVSLPFELPKALKRGLKAVKSGQAAVLDVAIE